VCTRCQLMYFFDIYLLCVFHSLSRQVYLSCREVIQLGTMPLRMWCFLILYWLVQAAFSSGLSMREIDGLVYTEEDVKLDRLEKHIFVWKVDLEGGMGESNMHLEALLAERLMRESALLMQTLKSYAIPEGSEPANGTDLIFRGEMGVAPKAYKPQPLMKEESAPLRKSKEKSHERRNGAAWAGGYVEDENSVKRTKRNVFGDIMHQLFGVATDEQLQQQLRVDEEMRTKVADTLTRQVYYEKELTMAISNITMEEDRMESRVSELEKKHKLG
jgi:hypothetical protein